MCDSNIIETLHEIFTDVFGLDDIVLTAETSAKDIENWDSVNHVLLITAIEKKWGIRFSSREMAGFKNVGDMIGLLSQKLSQ